MATILTLFTLLFLTACVPEKAELKFQDANNITPPNTTGGGVSPTKPTIATLPIDAPQPLNAQELNRADAFAKIPLRRLTRLEVLNSVKHVLGIDPAQFANDLPEDLVEESSTPFDNNSTLQGVSLPTVENYYNFAEKFSELILSNTSKVNALAGCTPTSANDIACFKQFASKVGKLLIRRPITTTELTAYESLMARAVAQNNFYVGVKLVVNYFLLSPEFLYRIEEGVSIAGSNYRELTNFEIATRLSYLIWGSAPDAALMTAAEAGQLKNEAQRIAQAQRMLNDQKAIPHWQEFHAQWLGYKDVNLPSTIEADMNQETNMLVNQYVQSNSQSWLGIFTHDQTYVTPSLARHYGFPLMTMANWVKYPRGGAGILSHGKFLVQGSKFGDTSPTLRGYRILKRVLCQKLGSIPLGIDTDIPPTGGSSPCKNSRYYMRNSPSCSSCHILTDNIGFGLENYSPTGQWRDTDPGLPQCTISSTGAVGQDVYNDIQTLGDVLSNHPAAIHCASKQLLRFAFGRPESTASDMRSIQALHGTYLETPQLKSMILALISSQGFINI